MTFKFGHTELDNTQHNSASCRSYGDLRYIHTRSRTKSKEKQTNTERESPNTIHERNERKTRSHAARERVLHAPQYSRRRRTGMVGVLYPGSAPKHRSLEKAPFARYIDGPHTLHRAAQPVYSRRSHGFSRLGTRVGSRRAGHIRRRTARTDSNSSSSDSDA
jgi:hypothetical protein